MSCVESRPPTVVDRYFSKHYRIDLQKKQGEDVCILSHSNKICILTLAASHPVLAQKKVVTKVNFKVGGADRLDNKTSGKSKRGAQWLGALAPLCSLTCSDASTYTICCGVKGQLIEANATLVDKPQLVNEEPWSTGYLGIMLPALRGHEAEMARLLTEDDYRQALTARLQAAADAATAAADAAATAAADAATAVAVVAADATDAATAAADAATAAADAATAAADAAATDATAVAVVAADAAVVAADADADVVAAATTTDADTEPMITEDV